MDSANIESAVGKEDFKEKEEYLKKEVEKEFDRTFDLEAYNGKLKAFSLKEREKIAAALLDLKGQIVNVALAEKWGEGEIMEKIIKESCDNIDEVAKNEEMKPEKKQSFIRIIREICEEVENKQRADEPVKSVDSGNPKANILQEPTVKSRLNAEVPESVKPEESDSEAIKNIVAESIYSQIKLVLDEGLIKLENHKKDVNSVANSIFKSQGEKIVEKMKRNGKNSLTQGELGRIRQLAENQLKKIDVSGKIIEESLGKEIAERITAATKDFLGMLEKNLKEKELLKDDEKTRDIILYVGIENFIKKIHKEYEKKTDMGLEKRVTGEQLTRYIARELKLL